MLREFSTGLIRCLAARASHLRLICMSLRLYHPPSSHIVHHRSLSSTIVRYRPVSSLIVPYRPIYALQYTLCWPNGTSTYRDAGPTPMRTINLCCTNAARSLLDCVLEIPAISSYWRPDILPCSNTYSIAFRGRSGSPEKSGTGTVTAPLSAEPGLKRTMNMPML